MALDYCNDKKKIDVVPRGAAAGSRPQGTVGSRASGERQRQAHHAEGTASGHCAKGTPVKEGGISLLIMIV